MDRKQLAAYVEEALAGLKDFQSASVDALHDGLYGDGRPRMLLADEVGLGKTIVARGLIARMLKQRLAERRRTPFKVTYICSNQVIAKENLRKLNPFPASVAMKRPVSRIAYLAYEEQDDRKKEHQTLLELNTMTPATSFQISYGAGNKWERRAIYAVLCHDQKMWNRRNGLRWLLKGTCNMKTYRRELDAALEWSIREKLPERLIAMLKRKQLPRTASEVYDELPGRRRRSLYDALVEFVDLVDGRTWKRLNAGSQILARALRECLIECCLRYVNADLYILDEFQRFRDLIDEQSEEEQAIIAKKVFKQHKGTRVLLLSATPFKAFTGHDEIERGEDHYEDFGRVLRFLLCQNQERFQHYEKHRKALYRQILELRSGEVGGISSKHRKEVEDVLRSVILRTERHSVAADANALIEDSWKRPDHELPFGSGDIENFRITDQLARALDRIDQPAGKPIDYCKSAIFPLSFLDRYKLKEVLKDHKDVPLIRSALNRSRKAWLNLEKIDRYQWSISGNDRSEPANARLAMLLDQAVGSHGAKLLWVPPSLPYYELEDAFTGSANFSKTLLFSSWIMVPRMISTLLSYEVERRTIGNQESVEKEHEHGPRTYFTPEGKRRHPIPQVTFKRRNVGEETQLANMSNFTLLFPSQSLAEIIDPVANLQRGKSLDDLRQEAATAIRARIDEANLFRLSTTDGEGDRWYWAAPLLLDRAEVSHRANATNWFDFNDRHDEDTEDQDGHSGAKAEHFQFLKECFDNPESIGLGRPPENLAQVLADIALGSPAVITLRTLTRLFPDEDTAVQMSRAARVADQFSSLFNKPESIAAIRLSELHGFYWEMVTDYCASGCLQAVLDEYFHLLIGQNVDPDGAVGQLMTAINLNASVINVDSLDTFQNDRSKKMRCHYAVEFGSQRIETHQGQQRASSIRELFNSPFRPFVLSTTSIGQEGLDFHSYCRRIVHWNLPGNPVDLEQREGRINRYKSLVIRQQLASKYRAAMADQSLRKNADVWEALFEIADREERIEKGKCELVPYWHVEAEGGVKIERVIPLYPFSIDRQRLSHILKTLAIYRLAFGQPRQAELVDYLLERDLSPEELERVLDALIIDLSPIRYQESGNSSS